MDLPLPEVSTAHRLNYTRYVRCIHTICPSIMHTAFKWLYIGGCKSLKELYEQDPSKFPNISKEDIQAIRDGKKLETLDFTLLYKLLQRVCNLAGSNDPVWYKKPEEGEQRSLEYVFHQLKVIRNSLSHPDPLDFMKISDEKLDANVANLQSLFEEVLVLSAKKGNVSDENLSNALCKMNKDIWRERNSQEAVSDEEFLNICQAELKNLLPSDCTIDSSYVIPRLKVESINNINECLEEAKDRETGISYHYEPQEYSLDQILECQTQEEKFPRIILVSGNAGSGKSTMCHFITKSYLENSSEVLRLQEYELVFPVQCSEIHTRDLQHLLRSSIIPESSATLDVAGLLKSLKKRKTLWLLDGWDEATREANGLITNLISNLQDIFPSHTVMITTRPNMASKLVQKINKSVVVCLSLLGLNDLQREEFLRRKANSGLGFPCEVSIDTNAELLNFLQERATEDFRNPLKLELMLQLWNEDPLELKSDASFTKLYMVFMKVLKRRLLAKLEKDFSPAENNTEDHIARWLHTLCKIAFEAVFDDKGLILDNECIKTLKMGFDPVLSSHCLSTFLVWPAERFKLVEITKYAFMHSTQRCVYAALHIVNSISEATDAEGVFDKIFQHNLSQYELGSELDPFLGAHDIFAQWVIAFKNLSSKLSNGEVWPELQFDSLRYTLDLVFKKSFDLMTGTYSKKRESFSNLDSFYPVFICVLEMHSSKNYFSQLPMKSFTKLIHLSLQESGNPSRWFEVIRKCNYNEDLLQEAKYYIDSTEWNVKDCDLKAAWELLSYVLPKRITLDISGDPMKLLDLDVLLFLLSKQKIEVHLCLKHHLTKCGLEDLSDKFLDILCGHNSRCRFTAFEGHLNFSCLQTFSRASKLKNLKLRTMDKKLAKQLCLSLSNFKQLESVLLVHDIKSYPVPEIRMKGRFEVSLTLPHMYETDIYRAFEFIAAFSEHYDWLRVGPLQDENLKELLELLSKKVIVTNIAKDIYCESTGTYISMTIGPVYKQILKHIPSRFDYSHSVQEERGSRNKFWKKYAKKKKGKQISID